jgi:hypothetical protein
LQDFPFLGGTVVRPVRNEGKNICLEVSAWGQGDKAFLFDAQKIKRRLFISRAAEVASCPK